MIVRLQHLQFKIYSNKITLFYQIIHVRLLSYHYYLKKIPLLSIDNTKLVHIIVILYLPYIYTLPGVAFSGNNDIAL